MDNRRSATLATLIKPAASREPTVPGVGLQMGTSRRSLYLQMVARRDRHDGHGGDPAVLAEPGPGTQRPGRGPAARARAGRRDRPDGPALGPRAEALSARRPDGPATRRRVGRPSCRQEPVRPVISGPRGRVRSRRRRPGRAEPLGQGGHGGRPEQHPRPYLDGEFTPDPGRPSAWRAANARPDRTSCHRGPPAAGRAPARRWRTAPSPEPWWAPGSRCRPGPRRVAVRAGPCGRACRSTVSGSPVERHHGRGHHVVRQPAATKARMLGRTGGGARGGTT